jgi:hypothetical protein
MFSVVGPDADGGSVARLPTAPSRATVAWRDLADGAARSWMWVALALQDIKLRYRGSILGPFWLTISTVVMVVAMGAIYSTLFHMDVAAYLPYLAIGLVIWQFISTVITEGCDTFLRAESVIQQIPIPFSIHAYRAVCRNLMVLAHSFVIIPIAIFIFGPAISWWAVEAAAGVVMLAINALWISVLLGMVSARFRGDRHHPRTASRDSGRSHLLDHRIGVYRRRLRGHLSTICPLPHSHRLLDLSRWPICACAAYRWNSQFIRVVIGR